MERGVSRRMVSTGNWILTMQIYFCGNNFGKTQRMIEATAEYLKVYPNAQIYFLLPDHKRLVERELEQFSPEYFSSFSEFLV